jgi:hypothetical protein
MWGVTMTHGGCHWQWVNNEVRLAFFGHETMCVYLFKHGVFTMLGMLKTVNHQTDGLKH